MSQISDFPQFNLLISPKDPDSKFLSKDLSHLNPKTSLGQWGLVALPQGKGHQTPLFFLSLGLTKFDNNVIILILMQKSKIVDIVVLANSLLRKGSFVISTHAKLRLGQRMLTIGDVKSVIRTGFHENKKDEFKEQFGEWNYAIRGKTLDGDQARICITFLKKKLFIVITAIRLEV